MSPAIPDDEDRPGPEGAPSGAEGAPRFVVQETWPPGVYLRISSRTSGA